VSPVRATVSLAATAVGFALLFSFRTPSANPAAAAPAQGSSASSAPTVSPSASGAPPSGAGSPSPSASATPTPSTGLSNGTYTGQTFTNFYGPVQVQLVISGGRITSVKTLQQPSSDPQSSFVASRAMPVLREEVLQAQSARIDVVSGATQDSESYAQSVQSALDQAGA